MSAPTIMSYMMLHAKELMMEVKDIYMDMTGIMNMDIKGFELMLIDLIVKNGKLMEGEKLLQIGKVLLLKLLLALPTKNFKGVKKFLHYTDPTQAGFEPRIIYCLKVHFHIFNILWIT